MITFIYNKIELNKNYHIIYIISVQYNNFEKYSTIMQKFVVG